MSKRFIVKGTVSFGGNTNTFSKEIDAEKKESAITKIRSIFGSNYKIKKHMVNVESAEEIHGKA
jgi:ribosomal protein L20A (L18A)